MSKGGWNIQRVPRDDASCCTLCIQNTLSFESTYIHLKKWGTKKKKYIYVGHGKKLHKK